MRKTKIICTLGPACCDKAILREMLRSGMNVARFNFSHGDHAYHAEMMETFRAVRDEMEIPAAVMLDTKGPEIRLKNFKDGKAILADHSAFTLTTREVLGDETIGAITFADLPAQLKPDDVILIDDGKISLQVRECTDTEIHCTVTDGGTVSNHKGINIPNVPIAMPYLSAADKADLRFGIEHDIDFVAASFVRSEEDVIELRNFLNYYGGQEIKIIAKIENIQGVNHFDAILDAADGIMVARGDMGVEIEYEKLPGIQKKFIRKCFQAGKMVITATQMLESMIHNTTPTRAEITDVANAVFDGTSAIMLSGETAMGDHPARVVRTMARIAEQAEQDAFEMGVYQGIPYQAELDDTTNAICDAACTTAKDLGAKAIIAVTKSGYTARRMSKFRPLEPIIAATPSVKTFHQLSLSWGVYPVLALNQQDSESLFQHAACCAVNTGMVKPGDCVVITAGFPLDIAGTTNVLRVQVIPQQR